MTILSFVVWLAVVGLIVWVLVTYVPMPAPIRRAIVAIAVVLMILWALDAVGALAWLNRPLAVD